VVVCVEAETVEGAHAGITHSRNAGNAFINSALLLRACMHARNIDILP